MNILKIASQPDISVSNFLHKYEIWYDYQVFYNKKSEPKRVIQDPGGVPCFHYSDVDGINSCDQPLIAINNLTESFHSSHFFKQYKTKSHCLIFSGGNWTKDMLQVNFSYDLIWHDWFVFEMADTFNSPNRFSYYIEKRYNFDYPKKYNWISTIGNVRFLRTKIVNELQKTNVDNCILRYSGQDLAVKNHGLDMVNIEPGQFDPYSSILEKYYHNISQTVPMAMYNSANFNIVVETDLDLLGSTFLTEKTLKSLITGMPFVSLANMGHLKHLQSLGFQTYGNLWDESYDDESNFDRRLSLVINLITELQTFDWQAHRQKLEYIALHNQSNFMHLTKRMDYEFIQLEQLVDRL